MITVPDINITQGATEEVSMLTEILRDVGQMAFILQPWALKRFKYANSRESRCSYRCRDVVSRALASDPHEDFACGEF